MRLKQLLRDRDDGATAMETALSLLVLVTLIIGVAEFAFSYWVLNAMQIAVAQGARYALAHRLIQSGSDVGKCQDPNTGGAVVTVVQNALPMASGSGQPFSTPTAVCSGGTTDNSCCQSTASSPTTITISVTYNNPIFGFFGFLTGNASAKLPTIGATATVPLI